MFPYSLADIALGLAFETQRNITGLNSHQLHDDASKGIDPEKNE
jgi:hypothetical protein